MSRIPPAVGGAVAVKDRVLAEVDPHDDGVAVLVLAQVLDHARHALHARPRNIQFLFTSSCCGTTYLIALLLARSHS